MKRKVIQVAESTQLISLPRRWALLNKIKKGDELEITEGAGQLIISTESNPVMEKVQVDVTGLDRTSILLLIRGLYKRGFDEIKVICKNPTVDHFRLGVSKSFLSVVHAEVNRLPGVEVIEQKEDYCVIKAISEPALKELDTVMRRLLLLINDAGRDMIDAAKVYDKVLLENTEQKHDSISKFTSYSIRLLSKSHIENQAFMFSIVNLLDKVMDQIKSTARLALSNGKRLRPEAASILERIFQTFIAYPSVHFKLDFSMVSAISRQKEEIREQILSSIGKLSKEETLIVESFESVLELYRGIVELRLAMMDLPKEDCPIPCPII